jgi:opine dehydrogenase
MNDIKIAVLGGGNGGHAMAADLTRKGYEVFFCEAPEFKESFSTTFERQSIDYVDEWGERETVKIAKVTMDFEETVKGARYVMMCVPAIGSHAFFKAIMPYLEDGQTVVKWSGNFSALSFLTMMKRAGLKKDIILAEGHTLPWGCRLVAPATIQIMVWVVKILFSILPAKKTDTVIKDIEEMYPVVAVESVLSTTLNNLNPVVHPVGTVMNAGWIDTVGKEFYFYRDGNTLSISRGIKAVYEEYLRVADAVGAWMLQYPEEDFWKKSAIMSTFSRATFDKEGAAAKISGPASVKSRYITEDIPYGLVPVSRLARKFNVKTPVIDSVIEMASVINQTDYREVGLSLEDLGIADFDKEELAEFLKEGG